MLSAANTRAAAAHASVDFVGGDMRDFSLDRDFSLIVVARSSLLHLLTTDDLLAAFTSVSHHLAPDGLCGFDIFNPDVGSLARPVGQRVPVMDVDTERFGQLRVECAHDYDAATQVNHAMWYVSTPEQPDVWVCPWPRFGDLSGGPFTRGSRMQICLCRQRSRSQ